MRLSSEVCEDCKAHSETVHLVRQNLPQEEDLFLLSDFYKVFSDSTRVRILFALDFSELCVCDLSEALSMSISAVSHQLRVLKDAKLVKYRKDGKNIFYSLSDAHVRQILEQGLSHIKE